MMMGKGGKSIMRKRKVNNSCECAMKIKKDERGYYVKDKTGKRSWQSKKGGKMEIWIMENGGRGEWGGT